jgi:hypothetical protein
MTHGSNTNALNPELTNEKIERIYHDWDAALARLEELPPERLDEGVEGLLALYAKDAILESPLIPHLTGTDLGCAPRTSGDATILGRSRPAQTHCSQVLSEGLFHGRKEADLGISPSKTGRRANGFRRIDGTERSRSDSTSRRVLGVARCECDACGRVQTLDRH